MHYDFRVDAQPFHDWLLAEVGKYRNLHDTYPDDFPAITRLEIAFMCRGGTTPPTLHLDWDTRPDPEPDGDATFARVAQLERPAWSAFRGPAVPADVTTVTASFPDGSPRAAATHTPEVDALLGNAVVALLLAAQAAGVFRRLPAPPDLKLNVTLEGWGWPPDQEDEAGPMDEAERVRKLSAQLADAFREKRWADVRRVVEDLGPAATELDLKRADHARRKLEGA